MTADEILKALEESEGFYLEAGRWVIAKNLEDDDYYDQWGASKYVDSAWFAIEHFDSMREALEYALKDGKP